MIRQRRGFAIEHLVNQKVIAFHHDWTTDFHGLGQQSILNREWLSFDRCRLDIFAIADMSG
jgi:hypothetical protein